MKNGIRTARIAQLIGAAFLIIFVAIFNDIGRGEDTYGTLWLFGGVLLLLGGRIYEWLVKE